VRILFFGGTRFAGKAASALAASRGHSVTLVHRGLTGADHLPGAAHVALDRRATEAGALRDALGGQRFDAVLDFCGYYPRDLRSSTEVLADSGWYGFVSSISAFPDGVAPGTTEAGVVRDPPDPEPDAIGSLYGELKVGCERVVQAAFGPRAAIVRPGFIVGPDDPTDRFPALLRGAAAGGTRLLPGPPEQALQFVDARDLAAFLVSLAEGAVGGTFLAVHPRGTTTLGAVVEAARRWAGADTGFVYAEPAWLAARCADDELEAAFPLWAKDDPGFHQLHPAAALAAGARHRPIEDTVADTLDWLRTTDRVPLAPHGLPPEREAALLAALSAPDPSPPQRPRGHDAPGG
jgi:2'-hydroxyisoflavone reductase